MKKTNKINIIIYKLNNQLNNQIRIKFNPQKFNLALYVKMALKLQT